MFFNSIPESVPADFFQGHQRAETLTGLRLFINFDEPGSDMLINDFGDCGPVNLDGDAGANLLAIPASVAPFPPDGRVSAHIDAAGRAVIDAEGAFGIEAFLPVEGDIKAAETGLL